MSSRKSRDPLFLVGVTGVVGVVPVKDHGGRVGARSEGPVLSSERFVGKGEICVCVVLEPSSFYTNFRVDGQ